MLKNNCKGLWWLDPRHVHDKHRLAEAEAYHWRRTWRGAVIFQIVCSALDRRVGSDLTVNVPWTKRAVIETDKLDI